ncbi:MAG: OmpA family protein [Bacteroidales bacterium]|nr:OmpA family protein [Bacteroidales bacterium]
MSNIKIFSAVAISLALAASGTANAQNILKSLGERAKNAVENSVGNKIENAVDKAVNGKKGKESKSEAPAAPASQDPTAATAQDFVRGGVVLFQDDFSKDPVGEYPAKWEVLNGSVDVYTVGQQKCAKVGNGSMRPFIDPQPDKYLSDEWTLEFDYYAKYDSDREGDMTLKFLMEDESQEDKSIRIVFREDDIYTVGDFNSPADNSGNRSWNKIQVSYNKGAFKVYRNGVRVINRNRVPQYTQFHIWGEDNTYVTNVLLCLGTKEKYEQAATEISAVEKAMEETGKFVTNNILFETGKADLKTESMIEIMKVADYMKKNPSVRFEVQGHCDNQGSDKVNDPLSQSRAEAIVKALVGLGVDEWNLKAVGKGSHEPVADNKTEEGRAQNRRVEFIKK